ncbi:FAD-dependent oxidoreductase [Compostibacter hankyongensis]|uniref:FAD-dependent oxidoreductase n=1 Tax=Compostibacter hankyongensis TaxID=1007089 RepID=A0ABP8FVJ7_9BACT
MERRTFIKQTALGTGAMALSGSLAAAAVGLDSKRSPEADAGLVVVGGTPGGIMTAIAAARMGMKVTLLERTDHIGGLPANGLGATDIGTRGATGGLFLEFVNRVKKHYTEQYGADSPQVRDCEGGYHFEPSVGEQVFEQMIAETPGITVRKMQQFDSDPENVKKEGSRIRSIRIYDRSSGRFSEYTAAIFVDATYEGDLAAAAGVPFEVGRESFEVYKEPFAGRVYKYWGGKEAEAGSTLQGDNAIQSFNYRLCLTDDPKLRMPVPKPEHYRRDEYLSLVEDVKTGRHTGVQMKSLTAAQIKENKARVAKGLPPKVPGMPEGMQRLVNKVRIPNNKNDANNQHMAFISTDLPEENWPWPTSSWDWRDRFAQRQKEYTLGLLWFAQHDEALPEWFRKACLEWGLARDEYTDNGNFPRQVYVREGRRMRGRYFFTAGDARPEQPGKRPPLHKDSITASHYAIDSHAVRKREEGRVHLDGFLSYGTAPYTVPYGVMVPREVGNLLMPVPVSGSHLGFSTLRMEPCWMALGHAAGVASALAVRHKQPVQEVDTAVLQEQLLRQKAILIYFKQIKPDDPDYAALQFFALKGVYSAWSVAMDEKITQDETETLARAAGVDADPAWLRTSPTRAGMIRRIYGLKNGKNITD